MTALVGNIQLRKDTAANWTAANPILLSGEIGIETDSFQTTADNVLLVKCKCGDGATAWNTLKYAAIGQRLNHLSQDANNVILANAKSFASEDGNSSLAFNSNCSSLVYYHSPYVSGLLLYYNDARLQNNTKITLDSPVINLPQQGSNKILALDTSSNVVAGSYAEADFELLANKGQAMGYAELDGGGKVPAAQLPSTVMELQGNWDATTNTPTLADGVGDAGDVWEVTTAAPVGTTINLGSGNITFKVGDWVVYGADGTWHLSKNSNEVTSVNSKFGTVVLNTDDILESGTPTNLWHTAARVRSVLLTGLSLVTSQVIAATDNVLQALGYLQAQITALTTTVSGKADTTDNRFNYWQTVKGTPVRVGNTSFTITDTSNANLYDMVYGRTTILKWTDTGVTKLGMIVSSVYAANNVTITIVGDTLTATATMSSFTYSHEKCIPRVFAIAGTLGTGTDLTGKYHAPCAMKVLGADGYHGTAGTTNATTYDINKNGTTMFTAKVSIASAATSGTGYSADSGTELATSDVISVDCDSVSTTAPIDTYIQLFLFPLKNKYLI